MTPEKQDGAGEIYFHQILGSPMANFEPFPRGHSHLLTRIIYVISSVTQRSSGVLKGGLLPETSQMLNWI